jgi:PAS domain S-box-containing protein
MTTGQPPLHALDSIAEGCQVIGPGWIYLYLNEAAARQGRHPREQLLGRSMTECFPGIEDTPMFNLLRTCMEERTHHHFENEFTYPDGATGWFDLRFEPVPEGVFILSLDITARKRAEQDRARLSTAIQHSAEAVIITDSNGTIVYVNPAFEEVTGYSRSDALGRNPRMLNSGKQDAAFYAEMWRTIAAGKTWRGRLVNKRKDGRLFTEEASISPVYGDDRSILHFVCVKRDITRELGLEEQYRQAQKMEAIGQLAGGVAHDFNNLLSLIIGYADVLLESVPQNNPLHADITEIRRAGGRAAVLTKQLLTFSRKQVLRTERLDLNGVVSGMEEMLKRLLGAGVELSIHFQPALATVIGDVGQMELVVMNLAINARDAMPRGGKLRIETANVELDGAFAASHFEVKPGHHVMLSVTDSGIGMNDETRMRVFEPFFTTKGADRGTGLGLATVYGIVKQCGGSIWVYSEEGVGTTFKIYFPFASGPPRLVTPASLRPIRPAGSEVILLVEDDEAVRELTRRLLTSEGYTVLAAGSAQEALSICEQDGARLSLMLSDVVMPTVGGVELAARIQKLLPDLPVLFMSGYAENAIAFFDEAGAEVHFIGKPFGAAALARKVREVLEGGAPQPGA